MTARRARPERGDAGYTLTEVLVAVSILTIAIVVVVGAMASGILASRVHRDIVTSDAVARRYSEQLVAGAYVPCANTTTTPYPAMTGTPVGYSANVTAITYWNGDGSATTPATFGSTCPPDRGIEQITIVARRTAGPGAQTIQILKRDA